MGLPAPIASQQASRAQAAPPTEGPQTRAQVWTRSAVGVPRKRPVRRTLGAVDLAKEDLPTGPALPTMVREKPGSICTSGNEYAHRNPWHVPVGAERVPRPTRSTHGMTGPRRRAATATVMERAPKPRRETPTGRQARTGMVRAPSVERRRKAREGRAPRLVSRETFEPAPGFRMLAPPLALLHTMPPTDSGGLRLFDRVLERGIAS